MVVRFQAPSAGPAVRKRRATTDEMPNAATAVSARPPLRSDDVQASPCPTSPRPRQGLSVIRCDPLVEVTLPCSVYGTTDCSEVWSRGQGFLTPLNKNPRSEHSDGPRPLRGWLLGWPAQREVRRLRATAASVCAAAPQKRGSSSDEQDQHGKRERRQPRHVEDDGERGKRDAARHLLVHESVQASQFGRHARQHVQT